jgi:hypothetical protein
MRPLDFILYSAQTGLEIRQLRNTQRRRSEQLPVNIAYSSSRNAVSFSSARTTKSFPVNSVAAGRALAAIGDGFHRNGLFFSRAFVEGCVARTFGDDTAARKGFIAARVDVERTVREQPDYGPPLCMLGLIDAGLGRKEEALREGRRASELLPVAKDAVNGANIMQFLGVIYAWTGEKDLAVEQIGATLQVPSLLSYGELKLHPFWDPLRGDPRFEQIVALLAPK